MIFKREAPKPEGLSLVIGDHSYTFATPAEFEFALTGRTSVPSSKLVALADVPDAELLKEAAAIKRAERRLAEQLGGVLGDSGRVNEVLDNVELSLMSNDHEWRAIIAALKEVPDSYERYKKIALRNYVQYLSSRHVIVKEIYQHRQLHKDAGTGLDGDCVDLKETAQYEPSTFKRPTDEAEYRRIPKGETLELSLSPEKALTLFVARHQCSIIKRGQLLFVDNDGRESSLREGRNIIGRDSGADIVLEASLRDISRKHLVIESDGTEVIRLTDISSHGTWVHPSCMEETGV